MVSMCQDELAVNWIILPHDHSHCLHFLPSLSLNHSKHMSSCSQIKHVIKHEDSYSSELSQTEIKHKGTSIWSPTSITDPNVHHRIPPPHRVPLPSWSPTSIIELHIHHSLKYIVQHHIHYTFITELLIHHGSSLPSGTPMKLHIHGNSHPSQSLALIMEIIPVFVWRQTIELLWYHLG